MPHSGTLPLTGMKVLDLSRALSGPFCASILGDLGADIIKVEAAPTGDMIRSWGPFEDGESAYYLSANRNKRSVVVDFRSKEGLALLKKMALASDAVIENFKPGTMAKMGLDPAELRRINPQLIVGSISGYGSSGPLSAYPGFDQIAQGYSGFMSFTGTAESGPTRVGVAVGDLAAGMWLTIGVLSAWIGRQRHGEGQSVETSLLGGLVGLLSVQGQRYLSLGDVARPAGNAHPVIVPYGVFRAADGEMNIAAATQAMWLKLCDVIGRADLKTDPNFIDNSKRMENRDALHAIIERELARHTRAEWTALLLAAEIPAGPINSVADALEDDQVAHLKLIETHQHPKLGPLRQLSNPIRLGSQDNPVGWIRRSPPLLGAHTREVLREFGLSHAEIEKLEEARTVYQREEQPVERPTAFSPAQ